MKRTAVAFSVLAALGGCVSTDSGRYMGESWNAGGSPACGSSAPPTVPGMMGPQGQPLAAAGAYAAPQPVSGEAVAKAMIAGSMPPELVQQAGFMPKGMYPMGGMPGMPGGLMPAGGLMPPGGVLIPAGGVPPGAVAAVGALTGGQGGGPGGYTGQFVAQRTSIRFTGDPEIYGLKVSWYTAAGEGQKAFSNVPLEVPGRYNFGQGAIYRLRMTDIPGFPAEAFYPTLEVVPANAKTATFLAHSSVPVTLTKEDFRTVVEGNYLVKVIYLPDPQYQDVAITGTGELISTQLEPGVDPIAEACKRGSILAVLRLGNIRLEERHTPAMDAPPPGMGAMPGMVPPGAMPPGMVPPAMRMGAAPRPGMLPPGVMVPPASAGRGPMPAGPSMLPPVTPPAGTPVSTPAPTTNGQLPPLPPQVGGQGK